MPVSAFLTAGLFVVAAAAPSRVFWAYLAILAAVMIVSFAALDPGPPA